MKSSLSAQFRELVRCYGTNLIEQPARLRELLLDVCPEWRRERHMLLLTLESGVLDSLRERPVHIPLESMLANCERRVNDATGLPRDQARRALEIWVNALESKTSAKPVTKPKAVVWNPDASKLPQKPASLSADLPRASAEKQPAPVSAPVPDQPPVQPRFDLFGTAAKKTEATPKQAASAPRQDAPAPKPAGPTVQPPVKTVAAAQPARKANPDRTIHALPPSAVFAAPASRQTTPEPHEATPVAEHTTDRLKKEEKKTEAPEQKEKSEPDQQPKQPPPDTSSGGVPSFFHNT